MLRRVLVSAKGALTLIGMRHLAKCLAAIAFVSLAAACDKSTSPPPPTDGGKSGTSGWRAVVGAGGLVGQTVDDQTWETRRATDADLFGVACVGNLLGWAAGAHGSLLHTTYGGRTWTSEDTHLAADLRAVRFGDALFGVTAGAHRALALTRDGGST